ncbi:MAG: DUF4382 domain-containing protein [Sinimarinibacterium sp.]|jgi:hypothetical protein
MPYPRRLLLACSALLLTACEGELIVDLTDAPVDGARRVEMTVSSIELLGSDGDVTTIDPDYTDSFDLLDYRDGATLRLLAADGELDGGFIGLRLRFDDDASYVRDSSGTSVPLELLSAGEYADLSLDFDGTTSAALVVDLDLRFSLIDSIDELGAYQMVPVIRVVDADTAGSISGHIDTDLVADSDCRDDRDLGEGLAVYLYPGSDVTPADYYDDGTATSLVQPVGSTDVTYDSDTDSWGYAFHYVAPGDYTLAWTCAADDEHPREEDALLFQASAGVSVSEAGAVSVDF